MAWWDWSFWVWNTPVRVYVSRDQNGKILGIFSEGKRKDAEKLSVLALEAWFVDGPEFGPLIFHRDNEPKDPTRPTASS